MNLQPATMSVIEDKTQLASDMVETGEDGWADLLIDLGFVQHTPTVETLAKYPAVQEELENWLSLVGWADPDFLAVLRDLCRAGYFPEYDPETIGTRAIKRRQVGGKTYVTGY